MSHPILYSATETNFDHNGFGILGDCASCEVTEEANGIFELSMTYPMDGIHFEDIADRAIIKAKSDQFRDPQLFRIYAISKPMSGIVTVLAEHISYDLSGIPVKPFSADSVALAMSGLKNNAVVDCPFEFWTDKSTSGKFNAPTPASIRSRLGGVAGSILDVYGGEYEFDNFTVKLHNNRGQNRGVSIRYGKNLTDIKQDQNCSNVATGIYPYWAGDVDGAAVLVELPERIINAPGTYNFVKVKTIDFTQSFETPPTVDQLRSKTESYIKNNNIGVPVVSWSVSFEQLSKSEEYKDLALLERVSLFDTVNVEFPALGVSATAKAVKLVYDVIADRVKSVTLGSVRANIADTIAQQQQEIIDYSKDKPSVSLVQKISSALAKAIMGANGGAVRLIDTNDDGEPDELYIADNPDPTQALKVWRFNYNGWAASKNGYAGPFEFGATLEEGLLANFVTAAQLVAGTIKSQDNGKTFFLDLDNGILNMNATSFSVSGKPLNEVAKDSIQIGGTNILLNSEPTETVYPWFGTNETKVKVETIDGKKCISVDPNTGTIPEGFVTQSFAPDVSDVYTLSAQVYANSAREMVVALWRNTSSGWVTVGRKQVRCSAGWNSFSVTFEGVTGEDGLIAGIGATKQGAFYVYHPKLEVGNKATSWSPAPADVESYSDKAALNAVEAQTQQDIFNKLFDNGNVQGFAIENGKLYINGEYAEILNLTADNIKTGKLKSSNGKISIDLTQNEDVRFDSGIVANRLNIRHESEPDHALFVVSSGLFGKEELPYSSLGLSDVHGDTLFSVGPTFQVQPDGSSIFSGIMGEFGSKQKAVRFSCYNDFVGMSFQYNKTAFGITADDGGIRLGLPDGTKQISWKDNGDGTYSLIGE